jgi:hypothetical protein
LGRVSCWARAEGNWAAGREAGLSYWVGLGFLLSLFLVFTLLFLFSISYFYFQLKLKPNEFKFEFEFTLALKQIKKCSSMMQQRNLT